MKKLKLLAQSHRVRKRQRQDLSPGLSDSSSELFYHHAMLLVVKMHTPDNFSPEVQAEQDCRIAGRV